MSSIAEINKKLEKVGWANVIRPVDEATKYVPTGILTYDLAMLGGVPLGHINQLIGYFSSGKTTLTCIIAAALQKVYPDKYVVFVDVEGTLDVEWAVIFGLDLSRIIIARPVTGEQAVDLCHEYLQAQDVCLVILDSVPQLFSEKMMEKAADEASVPGIQARLTSNLCSKTVSSIAQAKNAGTHLPTLQVINYWRSRIVMMGDPRSIPGGNHLAQASSTILSLKNKEEVKQDKELKDVVALFNEHSFEVMKNKLGNSIKQGAFVIRRTDSEGPVGSIDQDETLWRYGRSLGLITGGGSKFKIEPLDISGKKSEVLAQLTQYEELLEPFYHELLCRWRERYKKRRDNWREGNFLTVEWPAYKELSDADSAEDE